jgi:hypothetical protein
MPRPPVVGEALRTVLLGAAVVVGLGAAFAGLFTASAAIGL